MFKGHGSRIGSHRIRSHRIRSHRIGSHRIGSVGSDRTAIVAIDVVDRVGSSRDRIELGSHRIGRIVSDRHLVVIDVVDGVRRL